MPPTPTPALKEYLNTARRLSVLVRQSWRSLIATDLLFKLLAFAVLTPIFAALLRTLLAVTGTSVLSDVDIVRFFVGPFGWFCAIFLGSVWLAIIGLEQAALLRILASTAAGKRITAISAVRFALLNTVKVLSITTRLIAWTLVVIAPFLLIAGGVYFWLLGQYDINYYLNQRPSEFTIAVSIGCLLALLLVGILLRLYSGWFLALALVLVDKIPARDGLRSSTQMIAGNRRTVLRWLVSWLMLVLVSHFLLTALVGGLGQLLIPSGVGSLVVLAARVGLMLLVLSAASLIVNVLATILFAATQFHGYQQFNPDADARMANWLADGDVDDGQRRSYLTRFRLVTAGIIASLIAVLIGYWSLQGMQFRDDVQIMAHRGASLAAPENTMAAFRQAIADGADWIELDVQESAEGEVVVMHDSDFMKLSNNPLKIWDATGGDLADIDIGTWRNPRFAEQRVPTLAEVLRLCRGKIGVNIELKYYGHDQQLEQRVVDIVEAEQMADQILVMSLKPEGVAKIKALRPKWRCGLLLSVHLGDLQNVQADFLAVNSSFVTRNFVQRAHQADKQVFVWTVNDVASMSQALNRNVDGILTDDPALARRVLKERATMSNAERLLVELSFLFDQPAASTAP